MTRDDPAAFAPPPAFGPFRVLHQIGIGALGPVFRTYEPTRDRLVAVKLLRLDITPEQAQALADELARACDAGLFHPSIVEPIAAGVEGTAAYRAEEYVAAESLDVAIRHYAPASFEKVLAFITQLAGAIDFARTAGVGHGGLHLRDVFVTPDEARASGFGIVESLERVGIRAPVRRPYSAPERIAGGEWSTAADIFSLGAIAYELLTGRRPSGTGDQIGALAGENVGQHAAEVRSVLARAMHDDPARRYATALAFASALETAARQGVIDRTTAPAVVPVAVPPPRSEPEPAPQPAAAMKVPVPVEVPPEALEPDAVEEAIEEEAPVVARAAPLDSVPLHEDAFQPPPVRPGTFMGVESHEDERSRLPFVPLALGAIMLLLIGFAGGYALRGRDHAETSSSSAAANPAAAPASGQPAAGQPHQSGQAYSEQTVAQPSAAPAPGAAAPPAATAPRAAAATRATLTVESTPKNAPVTVNGKWRGRTPLTIRDLPFGTYALRVVQPGYTVAREDVTLTPSVPTRTLSFRLQRPPVAAAAPAPTPAPSTRRTARSTGGSTGSAPERFSGSLFVASNPPGARVFVDGRAVGTAPARIPEIPIGSHVVRLELPQHRAWTTSIRVAAGQETRVAGSLEPMQ